MKQTSRGRLLDAVNMVSEQIALASHAQELINVYTLEIVAGEGDTSDIETKLSIQKDILEIAIRTRRDMMSMILEEFKGDHHYWCEVKHSIGAYQFATEILYANPTSIMMNKIQQDCYENMIAIISQFVNSELVTCSRCLEDNLNSNENKQETTSVSEKEILN